MEYDDVIPYETRYNDLIVVGKDSDKGWRYGFINSKGEEIIECIYYLDDVILYHNKWSQNGLMMGFKEEEEIWSWVVFDSLGNEKIVQNNLSPYNLSDIDDTLKIWNSIDNNRLIPMKKVEGSNEQWGYINQKGEWVIQAAYTDAGGFSEKGLAPVQEKTRTNSNEMDIPKWGYIDTNGEMVIPAKYTDAGEFAENGLAYVADEEGNYGYINELGETVIPLEYESASAFSENGLAVVTNKQGDTGCLNSKGEIVIPFGEYGEIYEDAFNYSKSSIVLVDILKGGAGLAVRKLGIYDVTAEEEIVICGTYDYLWDMKDDCIKVCKGLIEENTRTKYGIIDYSGNLIVPVIYAELMCSDSDNWIAAMTERDTEGGRYQCEYLDETGNTVLELPEKYIYAGYFTKVK